jgi:hypothetical protein
MNNIILKFEDWLIDQQDREDLIGELARFPGVLNINPALLKRKYDEHKIWVDTVIRMEQPKYIFVFNDAWQEYLLAKKAAADASV